jgi:hypothetical protein
MRLLISRLLPPDPILQPHTISYQPPLHHDSTHASSPLRRHPNYHRRHHRRSTSATSSSSHCHIFWDLDNVQPTHVEDIPLIAQVIRSALTEDLIPQLYSNSSAASSSEEEDLPPPPLPHLTVFANPTTLAKFSPTENTNSTTYSQTIISCSPSSAIDLHQAVENVLASTLILTTGRKQSVDFAMKSAMLEYVQEERKKLELQEENSIEKRDIVVVCVSDDTDYVQVLKYLGGSTNSNTISSTSHINNSPIIVSSGTATSTISTNSMKVKVPSVSIPCRTVSVGEHKRRKRPAWAAPRKLDNLALPAACDAAITLARPRKNNTILKESSSGSSSTTAVVSDDIVPTEPWQVESVWVNPKRNWKERIEY